MGLIVASAEHSTEVNGSHALSALFKLSLGGQSTQDATAQS